MASDAVTDFFQQDTTHGYVKRIMYKKYLQAYIPIMLKSGLKAVILDGFAGAGRYGSSWPPEIEKYGSPVIALRVAIEEKIRKDNLSNKFNVPDHDVQLELPPEKLKKSGKQDIKLEPASNISLIFVEPNTSNFRRLFHNIKSVFRFYGIEVSTNDSRADQGIVTLQNTEFGLECHMIHAKFEQIAAPQGDWSTRYLTFLDPFGFSQIPMYRLKLFLGKYREVFINLMSSHINRFKTTQPQNVADLFGYGVLEEAGDNESIRTFVDDVVLAADFGGDQVDAIVANYENVLKKISGSEYVLTFEMRNKVNARLYHLVFMTHHIKGVAEMKESMNRCTQESDRLSLSDYCVNRKNQELSLMNDQKDENVAEKVFKKYGGQQDIPIKDIEMYILLETPFIYRKKILAILESDERITDVKDSLGSNTTRRRGTFPGRCNWLLTFKN